MKLWKYFKPGGKELLKTSNFTEMKVRCVLVSADIVSTITFRRCQRIQQSHSKKCMI